MDLAGDLPTVLGLPDGDGPGVTGWLTAGADVPVDALARLERAAAPRLGLLDRGHGPLEPARADVLAALLGADDATGRGGLRHAAHRCRARRRRRTRRARSWSPDACYLALRRAGSVPLRPTGVVLVVEPGRSLDRRDVEHRLGVPVVASVAVDPAVARAVDAGVLAVRLPRALAREVRHAA